MAYYGVAKRSVNQVFTFLIKKNNKINVCRINRILCGINGLALFIINTCFIFIFMYLINKKLIKTINF